MMQIAVTGSLSSGKTTASKILSFKKGPLFSADRVVKRLYSDKYFISRITKKLRIKKRKNIKDVIISQIINSKKNLKKLEKVIHPIVRKEMKNFSTRNKKKKFTFFEIPLLIESKLMKNFDVIIFIKAKKSIRLSRFKKKGGDPNLFKVLNKYQLSDTKKIKFCNHVIVNEKNIKILKKKLSNILEKYE